MHVHLPKPQRGCRAFARGVSIIALGALIALTTSDPSIARPSAPPAVNTDPPTDTAHPASTLAVEIPSHGSVMNGMVYRPSGAGPFPLIVLMHGLPGNEQNMDLAQALRRAGWAVMTFHYRGSWGSEGQFSIDHVIEDAKVAVAYSATPSVAKSWNTDSARIVVIGHSMGGLAAAKSSGSGPARLATILIAPWDPSTLATLMRPMSPSQRAAAAQDRWGDVTHGRLTGITSNEIAEQIVEHGERWRLADAAGDLAEAPLLIVTAARDMASSKAAALQSALTRNAAKFDTIEIASNHTFDDRRIELETVVLNWLSRAGFSPGIAFGKTPSPSETTNDRDIAVIEAARVANNRAIAAHDLKAFLPMFAEDAVFTWSNGTHAVAKKELAAFFSRDFADPNFDRYVRTPAQVSVSDRGVRALERGTWTALKTGTHYGGDYIAHWMKGPEGWHVVGELYVKLYCKGPLCTD